MMITYGTVKCQTEGCQNELHCFGRHLFGGEIKDNRVFCYNC